MSEEERKPQPVRRFIDVLTGAENDRARDRFDLRLARAIVERMEERALDVAGTIFAPLIYRVRLAPDDMVGYHLDQARVRDRYAAFLAGEIAHEMTALARREIAPSSIAVVFVAARDQGPGTLLIDTWYGDLISGDAAPVVDRPTVSAERMTGALRQSRDKRALRFGDDVLPPRQHAVLLTTADFRFWTQYPPIRAALESALREAIRHGDAEPVVTLGAPARNGDVENVSAFGPIAILGDGSTVVDAPAPASLSADDILRELSAAVDRSAVVIGDTVLAPRRFVVHLAAPDVAFWTHFPEIADRLAAYLRGRLVEQIRRKTGPPQPSAGEQDLAIELSADDALEPGSLRVDATDIEAIHRPAAPEAPPAITLVVSTDGEPDEKRYPIARLPATVGRLGGEPVTGENYVGVDVGRGMSRRHFAVASDGRGGFTATVLPSARNRTLLNDVRIATDVPVPVRPGDELFIAGVRVRFEGEIAEPSDEAVGTHFDTEPTAQRGPVSPPEIAVFRPPVAPIVAEPVSSPVATESPKPSIPAEPPSPPSEVAEEPPSRFVEEMIVSAPASAPGTAALVAYLPDGSVTRRAVEGFPITFGTAADAPGHVQIADPSGTLAPVHARIEQQETGHRIVLLDAGSTRTLAAGKRLAHGKSAPLPPFSTIRVGSIEIRLDTA